jgi:hypothetical protein
MMTDKFDKTTFINTAYTDENSDEDFVKGLIKAYRNFIGNKIMSTFEDDEKRLREHEKGLEKTSEYSMVLNLLATLISSLVDDTATQGSLFLRMLSVRLAAMESGIPEAVDIITSVMYGLSSKGTAGTLEAIKLLKERGADPELVKRLTAGLLELIEYQRAMEAGNCQCPKCLARRGEATDGEEVSVNTLEFDPDDDNIDIFIATVDKAVEEGSGAVVWEGNNIPMPIAKGMAKILREKVSEYRSTSPTLN